MKSARAITKTNKSSKLHSSDKNVTVSVIKRKTPAKNIFSKTSAKITPHAQFMGVKQALREVELIEAGTIKPKSLDDLLNEL